MPAYLETLFSLTGRPALVTGASSGIGHAIAEALGRAGASLVITARRPGPLAQAAEHLTALGIHTTAIPADLADPSAIDDLCRQATASHGDIDILVNNAANNIRRPLDDLTAHDYDHTLAVNLTAPYLLGRFFGPRMAARGWGRIINLGSQQSLRAFGDSGAYGIAKTAVTGLTRSQAEAWSPHGVCVNTLIPGFTLTPLTRPAQAIPGRVEALAARTMNRRNAVPADYAGIAVLLASPAGAHITGQAICVDGGFSAH
ncbi:SDR family NAD(P)-dependent oxidoreductase [Streptosporangium sandarakinum]|uniref:SDR family NAD(P)-dependent oxidoreductase n=1 Tax=Streptosporangium sandarakinum TaxID=1260955 RepID=UPI0033BCF8D1